MTRRESFSAGSSPQRKIDDLRHDDPPLSRGGGDLRAHGRLVVGMCRGAVASAPQISAGERPAKHRRLVPAHNEALVILRTLTSLAPQLLPGDRVVVIADNCSDATAQLATQAGAMVLDRRDPVLRGKSYALDFAVRAMERNPPEVFVVIDADCTVHPGALDAMARLAFAAGRPVQASYVLELPADAKPPQRLTAMAFRVKNHVRPNGLDRLGLPCFLNGSGMGFSPRP